MGTYNIPRNVKGEGRILFIFSTKALIWSGIMAIPGGIIYVIFSFLGMDFIGLILLGIFALIGFSIGTFKIPNITKIEITKKTAGDDIDDVIKRVIKFKMKKSKTYVYMNKEDRENG